VKQFKQADQRDGAVLSEDGVEAIIALRGLWLTRMDGGIATGQNAVLMFTEGVRILWRTQQWLPPHP